MEGKEREVVEQNDKTQVLLFIHQESFPSAGPCIDIE